MTEADVAEPHPIVISVDVLSTRAMRIFSTLHDVRIARHFQ